MFITEIKDIWGDHFSIDELFEFGEYHDKVRFYIYDDSLKIPVFHIRPVDSYIDICICLFRPNYYQYNKKGYKYNLELDKIDKFLRDKNINNSKLTNWQCLVEQWRFNNEQYDLKGFPKQPDYTKLDDNKIIKRSLARTIVAKWYA